MDIDSEQEEGEEMEVEEMEVEEEVEIELEDPRCVCVACGRKPEKALRCTSCNFAVFCSKECQRAVWKEHKPMCSPLGSAVKEGINALRGELRRRDKVVGVACRICNDSSEERDIFELECGCANPVAYHEECFMQLAKKRYVDAEEYDDPYCGMRIAECCKLRCGRSFLILQLCLNLYRLHSEANGKNFDSLNSPASEATDRDEHFLCLTLIDTAFGMGRDVLSSHTFLYTRLRLLWHLIDALHALDKSTENSISRIINETEIFINIAHIMHNFKASQQALRLLRRSQRRLLLLPVDETPVLLVARKLMTDRARILLNISDSDTSLLSEAEELITAVIKIDAIIHTAPEQKQNPDNLSHRFLLVQILTLQAKYQQSSQLLTTCIPDATELLGDAHSFTEHLKRFSATLTSMMEQDSENSQSPPS